MEARDEAAAQDRTEGEAGGLTRRAVLWAGSAAAVAASAGVVPAAPAVAAGGAPTISDTPFGTPTETVPEPGTRITAVRGDRAQGWASQTRSEVLARNGVVATSQTIAAGAGLQMLRDGGTSADAAVATAAVLGLVEPESTGLGGDMFAIHYSAADRKLYAINASGWSPKAWTQEYFTSRGYDAKTGMPYTGIGSVTVPGAPDGWAKLAERFGTRGLAAVLAPAIQLAEDGFGVTERIRHDWSGTADLLKKDPDSAKTFLPGGNPPGLYSIFRNPDLAHAYRTLAEGGRDAYYKGPIAAAIVAKSTKLGGAMTAADLAEFEAEWVDPIHVSYQGYEVHQVPPNCQGFATLIMLNVIDQITPVHGYDLAKLGPRSVLFWHFLVEAKKLAYDELNRYNGDPRFVRIPMDRLLSKSFARELCRRIDPGRAHAPKVPGQVNSGTVYLTAADRWGNMTSFIYSVFDSFGSGITVPGYGFPLQNRGALFNLDPKSPNSVAPHKRPYHTIIPAFVTRDGRPVMSFGNMGGGEQAQAQATELVNMINLGMNPQAASDAARFYHNQFSNVLTLEAQLDALVGKGLAAKGHKLAKPTSSPMGGFQAIHFTPSEPGAWPAATPEGPVNGLYRAGSDHRKDGTAVGY